MYHNMSCGIIASAWAHYGAHMVANMAAVWDNVNQHYHELHHHDKMYANMGLGRQGVERMVNLNAEGGDNAIDSTW